MLSASSDKSDNSLKPGFSFRKWPNKDEKPRNFGSSLRIISSVLAIFIASQFLAALIVSLVLKIVDPGTSLSEADNSTPVQFAYVVLAQIIVVLLVLRLLKNRGLKFSSIGLGRSIKLSDITRALLGFGAFYGLLIAAGALLTVLAPDFKTDQPQDIGFENLESYYYQVLAFAALVFFAPVGEEVLSRGYLFSGLRSRLRFFPSMLATSLLFSAAHLPGSNGLVWGAAINTFFLSIVLVYLREKSGALYAGIIIHALNNLVAYIVLF